MKTKETMPVNGKFELITLPYDANALEPIISSETIGYHHGKHLQTYVNNLNAALPGSRYEGMSLEEIVKTADGTVFNNAGQILNHNMYFTCSSTSSARPAIQSVFPHAN